MIKKQIKTYISYVIVLIYNFFIYIKKKYEKNIKIT